MNTGDFTITSRRMLIDDEIGPAVVSVSGGRIANVSRGVSRTKMGFGTHVDIGDLVVMPGIVDTHVHVNEPGRTEWEGFRTAGLAAAAGGVTTMVVMPLNCSPVATTMTALEGEAKAAAGVCLVDYGLWGGVVPGNTDQIEPMWKAGVLGFKCFLVHSGIDEFPGVSEKELDEAMAVLARCRGGSGDDRGAVLLAHAEDPAEIVVARGRSGLDASPRNYAAYLASRPPVAEERAIEMMIRLCRKHRGRVHIVHVSAATALPALAAARQVGLPISTETCPHYLAFAAEKIGDGRTMFKCAPPIREGMNRELLWKGLREGVIDLIASDHSPCPPELKQLDAGHFAAAWGGISSLQLGLPVVWTQARSRGFGIADVSRWMSAAPARLAGIDGFKGRIAPGYDADLLIFDPDEQWTVRGASLHHRHKLTPYDGSSLRGVVKRTILRGETVFDSSLANPFPMEPAGRWITRTRT